MGPYTPEEVRSSVAAGSVQPTDLAWHEGAPDWKPLASIPGFGADALTAIPRQIISPPPPSTPTSGLAIASLVLGILSLIAGGLTAIPAIICGHISRSHIKNAAGRMSGNGLAMGGLITGYLGLLSFVAVLASLALPVFAAVQGRAHEKAQEMKCLSEARQIARACKLYAVDHGGFPPSLDELVPKYLPDAKIFECPLRKGQAPMGYDYVGGKDTDSDTKVLLSSKATTRAHQRIVVTSDGAAALKREN
jgi:hypothetical protein